ncbi:MAG TPA: hypothetical protein VNC78_01240 [Actinomycetota bacterium]|nr:hypothetical protein [Actinomycetota bacterium]
MTIAMVVSGLGGGVAGAGHNADDHSENVELVAEHAIVIQKDNPDTEENEQVVAAGSDLAFQGDLLVAGSYEGVGFFKMRPTKPYLEQISFFPCAGGQGDVGVWGNLVFMSVDAPQKNSDCVLPAVAATPAEYGADGGWEGLRIISIKNLKRPKQVAAIKTPCGSHTHTIAPSGKKLYIYIESYPLSGQGTGCNPVSHRKVSIMEVPLANPAKAKLLDPMATPNTIGCHDITMFPSRQLAVAACVSESQVWDVKNPAKPELLATIHNPAIQIHHSTGFTWDGKYLVLGDEFGGAAAGGCVGNSDVPMGAMWFYDIADPTSPEQVGYYAPPRVFEIPDDPEEAQRPRCTTHNFNIVPTKDQSSYIAVTSYYSVALSVVDFSDPTNAKEIGYYLPKESGKNPDSWSAYWYNGLIYTNDHGGGAGIRVFRMKELNASTAHYFKTRLNPQTQMM